MSSLSASQRRDAEKSNQDQISINRVLGIKRKPRDHTACYPCRHRKVKCDLSRPCKTCRERDHPDLCNYRPSKDRHEYELDDNTNVFSNATSDPNPTSSSSAQHLELLVDRIKMLEIRVSEETDKIRSSIAVLQRSIQAEAVDLQPSCSPLQYVASLDICVPSMHSLIESSTDSHGISAGYHSDEIVHVENISGPALLHNIDGASSSKTQISESLSQGIVPSLNRDDESAAYIFIDHWASSQSSVESARGLARVLPVKDRMVILFQAFRDQSDPVYPSLASIDQFENQLDEFFVTQNRAPAEDGGNSEGMMYGKDFHWLALLYAVLASGAQVLQTETRKLREVNSKYYVCCSFACLRLTNFLDAPHLEDLQALVLIGHVLSNNMNADAAWSLLGLTKRLAQGIGIHETSPPHDPRRFIYQRSKIWWSIVWQDSLLSLSFDRNTVVDLQTSYPPQTWGSVPAYHISMYRLSKIGLTISQPIMSRHHTTVIQTGLDDIDQIIIESDYHLRDPRHCSNSRQYMEYWSYRMHSSYVISKLCRPVIEHTLANSDMTQFLRRKCIDSSVDTLEGFLELTNFASFSRHSWDAVHRGVSSALLLATLGEHLHNTRARTCIIRVITLMDSVISEHSTNAWQPIIRTVEALKQLKIGVPLYSS